MSVSGGVEHAYHQMIIVINFLVQLFYVIYIHQ